MYMHNVSLLLQTYISTPPPCINICFAAAILTSSRTLHSIAFYDPKDFKWSCVYWATKEVKEVYFNFFFILYIKEPQERGYNGKAGMKMYSLKVQ